MIRRIMLVAPRRIEQYGIMTCVSLELTKLFGLNHSEPARSRARAKNYMIRGARGYHGKLVDDVEIYTVLSARQECLAVVLSCCYP